MEPIISFKNFSFQYYSQSEPTLHDINLDIYPGEKILIAGPSGSGKSTMGHCINGLIPNSYKGTIEGSLTISGLQAGKASLFDISKKVGTVLQDSDGQFFGLTVGEDIAFALENDCVKQDEMIERVNKISKMVSMDQFLDKNPHELSGGQKQRVSLAGVMVDDVDILLFDEPLANLDPKTGKVAIELIDELADEGKTVIIIEHRVEDVLHRHVDRIVLVDEGRIIMDDTPDKVLSTDIFLQHGIREPLYLTCCKYAGVNITPDMYPSSLEKFNVESCKDKIKDWYRINRQKEKEENKEVLLSVKDLSFSYDGIVKHLEDINMDVYKGEMLSVVGKNGAGKSTLSKLIVGFDKADTGSIKLEDKDISFLSVSEIAEDIGLVLQNPNQMISQTMIFDEVAFGLKVRGIKEEEIKERVEKVLRICGLYEFRNWPVSALSYGQKKRVTIASILILNPKILILDEPTAGQDYAHYSEIMEFLKSLNDKGQTIILITHDMHLMLEYTDRAVVLCEGKKVADEKAYIVLCDKELTDKANLKETSLFDLATKASIDDPEGFVKCFIDYEKKLREERNEN